MYRWKVTIEAWPFSTGVGQDEDQKAAGDRVQTYTVQADNIRKALGLADLIATGIKANPRVWQAPIMSIVQVH